MYWPGRLCVHNYRIVYSDSHRNPIKDIMWRNGYKEDAQAWLAFKVETFWANEPSTDLETRSTTWCPGIGPSRAM